MVVDHRGNAVSLGPTARDAAARALEVAKKRGLKVRVVGSTAMVHGVSEK